MTESRRITARDLENRDVVVVLPLGSWEQHGPHLPLDTDTVIITSVVSAAVQTHPMTERLLVAPAVSITASDEHAGFPGGLSTGTEALVGSVVAVCRSASQWARGVVIANGHGGNSDALTSIASALDHERITHSVWSLPSYAGGDMHAGLTETSLMLHLDAPSVRLDEIPVDSDPGITVDDLRTHGVQAVSPSGVLGRPSRATAGHGEKVFAAYRDSLSAHLTDRLGEWLNGSA